MPGRYIFSSALVQRLSGIPVYVAFRDHDRAYWGRLDGLEVYETGRLVEGRPHVWFSVPGNFKPAFQSPYSRHNCSSVQISMHTSQT
jgi:hypothetical protein